MGPLGNMATDSLPKSKRQIASKIRAWGAPQPSAFFRVASDEFADGVLWRRKNISHRLVSPMFLPHRLGGRSGAGGATTSPGGALPYTANDTTLLLGSSSSWCCYCFFDNNTDFRLTSHGDIFLPLFLAQHKLLWHPRDRLRHSSAAGLVPQRWTSDPQHCCGWASKFRGTKGNSGGLRFLHIGSASASQLHLVPLDLAQFPLARRAMKENVEICKCSWTLRCCFSHRGEGQGSSGTVHSNYKINHAKNLWINSTALGLLCKCWKLSSGVSEAPPGSPELWLVTMRDVCLAFR